MRTLLAAIAALFGKRTSDLGTLPASWTPTRHDIRRHNREMREIRG